jgi:hypothetical protein
MRDAVVREMTDAELMVVLSALRNQVITGVLLLLLLALITVLRPSISILSLLMLYLGAGATWVVAGASLLAKAKAAMLYPAKVRVWEAVVACVLWPLLIAASALTITLVYLMRMVSFYDS